MTDNSEKPAVNIDGRRVGEGAPPYVVAELSGNHNGELRRAFELIEAAKSAGADAVKIQTYTADTITINHSGKEFVIEGGPWNGRSLYDLYSEAHTPWEWHAELFDFCRSVGITIFSSPFDDTAISLLTELNAPAFKIASFEAIDLPLIKTAAETGRPLIISTGMANEEEIAEAVGAARSVGCEDIVLLHCVSGYPAPVADSNLRTMLDLKTRYNLPIGLSDHTLGSAVAVSAVALGASFIEKHMTLRRADGGPDAEFSLEPDEFKQLCRDARAAFDALGTVDYGLKSSERGNAVFRRSLYVVEDIKAGAPFTTENVRSIRPGYGLPPKLLPDVLGQTANCDIPRGTALKMEHWV